MANKPTQQPAAHHPESKWREYLSDAGVILWIIVVPIGTSLSLWDDREVFKDVLMTCSPWLFGLPQWFNGIAIMAFWWFATFYGLQHQADLTPPQVQRRSLRLAGFVCGFLFYLFQDTALALIKTVIAIVVVLIGTALGAGGAALPFGLLGFGGPIRYDDWDRYDDYGHRDDY